MTDESTVRGALARAAAAVERFGAAAAEGAVAHRVDKEQILDEYVLARRVLANAMRDVAISGINEDCPRFREVRRLIEAEMVSRYGEVVPTKYLRLRGFRGVHPTAFEYLAQREGSAVPASRLRILTADQVHTERRVRELRDLGLEIHAERVADENQYTLVSAQPDVAAAAATQLARNLDEDKSLHPADRRAFTAAAGISLR